MTLIRRLDTNLKVYICFALLLALSAVLAWAVVGQLGPVRAQPGQAAARLAELAAWSRLLVWAGVGAQAVLALLLALWLKAELDRPVQEAAGVARRIAAGDLSTRIDAAGAGASGMLLGSMQEMNDQLVQVVARVRDGTGAIVAGAGALACAGTDLSARSERHAAALRQVALSLDALENGAGKGQHAALAQLSRDIAALEESAHENAMLAQQSCEAAALVRDQTGSLARLLRSFHLGPGYTQAGPRIHLVSINRHPIARSGRDRRKQVRIAAVTAGSRDAVSDEEMNWQTF